MSDIQQYLEDSLDVAQEMSTADGTELVLRECLFCGKPRKMYVNLDKLKYNCFSASCDARGKVVTLIMAIEDCGIQGAREILKDLLKGLFKKRKPPSELAEMFQALSSPPVAEKGLLNVPLPKEFQPCFNNGTWTIPQYLVDRKISKATLRKWNVGYCNSGKYSGRIIIPVESDGMSTFVARDVTGQSSRKYLNPAQALQGAMLFGYDKLKKNKTLVAVEGVFDAMRLDAYGFPSVAYFGSLPRSAQTRLLQKSKPSRLMLMPDHDAQSLILKYASEVAPLFDEVRLARLKAGDPDSATRREAFESLAKAERVTGRINKLKSDLAALLDSNKYGA